MSIYGWSLRLREWQGTKIWWGRPKYIWYLKEDTRQLSKMVTLLPFWAERQGIGNALNSPSTASTEGQGGSTESRCVSHFASGLAQLRTALCLVGLLVYSPALKKSKHSDKAHDESAIQDKGHDAYRWCQGRRDCFEEVGGKWEWGLPLSLGITHW